MKHIKALLYGLLIISLFLLVFVGLFCLFVLFVNIYGVDIIPYVLIGMVIVQILAFAYFLGITR